MSRFERLAAALLVLFSGTLLAQTRVQVVGLFPDAAVLNIDGQRQLLRVGERAPSGVELISADSQSAVLRVDGEERSYALSRDYGEAAGEPAQKASMRIARGIGAHYWVAGSINGRTVQFLVDTGATAVAMNEVEARRLGIDFRATGSPVVVSTAGGSVQAWRISLQRLKIGALEVLGVDAVVLAGDSPSEVLLGMSFLSRVNWREEQGMLVLEAKY
jgi:aspartyl protease family protein